MTEKINDIGLRFGSKKLKRLEEVKELLEKTILGAEIEAEMNEALMKKVEEMIERERKD